MITIRVWVDGKSLSYSCIGPDKPNESGSGNPYKIAGRISELCGEYDSQIVVRRVSNSGSPKIRTLTRRQFEELFPGHQYCIVPEYSEIKV